MVGAAATVDARDALNASRNRIGLERAGWIAWGCVALVQEEIDRALSRTSDPLERSARWRMLRREVDLRFARVPDSCEVALRADGDALDVNRASEEALVAYFEAAALGPDRHDLAQALLDWVDADDSTRAQGAERAHYHRLGRIAPRNGPLADPAELRLIAGFESLPAAALGALATTGGRVSINTAPREVLATVPGFGPELVDRLRERALRGEPLHDLLALERLVSPAAAERVRARFPEIVHAATVDPDAWFVTARARTGVPPVEVHMEARLIRSGSGGTAVSRRRTW